MTDEKKKGKALNALKKKFNTGGRVNARRGGRRNNLSFSKEDLNTAQAKEFFRSTSKTAEPKKPTQTAKTSAPKKPTGFQQINPSAINKTGGGLDLGQQPKKSTGFQQMGEGTLAPSISPMSPREQMGYNSVESKEGLTPRRGENSRRIPAGDANNIKSMLFQQMDIADKTDKSFDASKATTEQLKALKKLQENAQSVTASQEYQGLLEEYERTKGDPKIKAQLQQKLAPFQEQQAAIMGTQSPRGAANVQQAQNAGQAVMAQSAGAGTDFNIDVDLSGMPQRENYGRGKEGNDAYRADLKAWQASLGDTGSSGGEGSDTPPTSEELDEKKEELKQTQENYVAPKAEVVKAGQAIDHNAIIQDAMNRQPLFGNPPQKMMDYSYDKESGEYVIDNAGWGFEGDARFTRLSPEEFYDKMGINPNKFIGDDPSLSTSEEDIQKLKTGEDRVGIDDPTDVTAGTTTVEQGTAKTADSVDKVTAKTITADVISDEDRTRAEAATDGTFDDSAKAGVATLTNAAAAVGRDAAQEQAAMAKAATRPIKRDYAEGATSEDVITVGDVTGPTVETRDGITISDEERERLSAIAQGRGVDLEDLPEYKDKIKERTAQSGEAAAGTYVPRLGETPEATAARAEYFGADYTPQGGKTEIDAIPAYAKAATRVAQVGVAAERIASELGTAPSVDFKGREAITGTAPQGDASQIGGIPTFEAASRNAVTGKERTVAAADMMAVVADIPEDVTAAISEDPATVEAQIDSGADPQVTAAVAALPQEALVSVQMENLLAGMEDGKTPAWARPAVAAIEQQMAQRGLSASTVGRDALFNAIIQSALPMAQSNAQALQQRAQQNLSNQQQANLASAQNTMTVRMQNLANRQTAASQTASMAQEIKVQQGSFSQQATITTAQQKQQAEMATFQAAQQKAQQESAQRQQAAIAELSTNAQMDLANLQALNAAGAENMSAEQQGRLTKYNAQIAKVMRQADLKQDMEKANLNSSLQMRLANLSEMNAAAKDTMTAENQEELTNLQTLVDFRKTDAQFAQQMDMANMSNEQQMELAMLQDRAATDSANFTADNQFRDARA